MTAKFFDHTQQAIQEWFSALSDKSNSRGDLAQAIKEHLIVEVNGELCVFSGDATKYNEWMNSYYTFLKAHKLPVDVEDEDLPIIQAIREAEAMEREFGAPAAVQEVAAELQPVIQEQAEEVVRQEEEDKAAVIAEVMLDMAKVVEGAIAFRAPEVPQEEPEVEVVDEVPEVPATPPAPRPAPAIQHHEEPSETVLMRMPVEYQAESFIEDLPQAYEVLRRPIILLLRNNMDQDVIQHLLFQADEAFNAGKIKQYARKVEEFVNLALEKKRDIEKEHVRMFDTALKMTCADEPSDPKVREVYRKLMELTPEGYKVRSKSYLDKLLEDGMERFMVPAWIEVEAAINDHRTKTPFSLFQSIVSDLEHKETLAKQRVRPKLTDADTSWLRGAYPSDAPIKKFREEDVFNVNNRFDRDVQAYLRGDYISSAEYVIAWQFETNYARLLCPEFNQKMQDKRFSKWRTRQQLEDNLYLMVKEIMSHVPNLCSLPRTERRVEILHEMGMWLRYMQTIVEANEMPEFLQSLSEDITALYNEHHDYMSNAEVDNDHVERS